MVDDKAAHLQSESNRLAAKLNAEPVKVGVLLDNDNLNIFNRRWRQVSLQLLGARSRPNFDRVGEMDDVLYWFAEGITHASCSRRSAADPAWEARFIEAMSGARFRCAYLNAEESPGSRARRWRAGSPSGLPPASPSPPPGGRSSPAGPTAARGRPSGAG